MPSKELLPKAHFKPSVRPAETFEFILRQLTSFLLPEAERAGEDSKINKYFFV